MKNNQNKPKRGTRREQPRKDSKSKRINLDNERVSKFEEDEGFKKTNKCNDVKWYANNPELLRSAASLPFSQTTGQLLPFMPKSWATSVPGVMGLYFVPQLGGGELDAINTAKDELYSYVVHANSRNTSYNASDLMLTVVAGAQIFAALGSAIRAYGIMRTFDQRNKYLPKGLIAALGFDYEDLKSNLSHMWFDINELIARSSQIWIPNTMPILDRWFWLNSNVYMDSASVKGQYYVFVQDGFLGFNETTYDTGTALEWMKSDGTLTSTPSQRYSNKSLANHTWADFMKMINGMFSLLLDSEDRGIMMGDIMKAYGAERLYALSPITSDYRIVPVYDQEVLTQIENTVPNALMYSDIQQTADGKIVKNANFTSINVPANVLPKLAVLNFHTTEVPTPEMIMVATRLMNLGIIGYKSPITNTNVFRVAAIGSESVVEIHYISYDYSKNPALIDTQYRCRLTSTDATSADTVFRTCFAELAFDWSPWLYLVDNSTLPSAIVDGQDYSNNIEAAVGDYDNYTVIDSDSLIKMHNTAMYSLFGVPII